MTEIRFDEAGDRLLLRAGDATLAEYVFRPDHPTFESPRPYLSPIRTLGGELVSLYRPHDHVWHKGLSLALPHVGEANLWGGVSWVPGEGYRQLTNNGSMRHLGFDRVTVQRDGTAVIDERLVWVTQRGQEWFEEQRGLQLRVEPALDAWVLDFTTRFTNVSGRPVSFGSPTTHGRPNAGYGGLFWRGPRSFTGGIVTTPHAVGGNELMGERGAWMAYTGVHDGHGRSSTIVLVDAPTNPTHPTRWFVRATPFACLCPAPFFDCEILVGPGQSLALRYAAVVADGDAARAQEWARLGARWWQ